MQQEYSNTPDDESRAFANHQLASAQTLVTITIIASPVSLVIGGLPLGIVALICGIVALSKIRAAIEKLSEPSAIANNLKRQAIIGISVSIVSIVLNAISIIIILPAFIEFLQSGDITKLTEAMNFSSASTSSGSNSVWD
ncbi:hypothetical protein [Adlercreutzia sp. ZJ304]|uniref:hypothetical protein n=1 Tax=Adlercreutzia sp. ZJ304 TaxID=2709791 RepID=UPI0013EC30E7|nr:hypothetical protein [Adlercreutzia sp. ZJ304]